MSEHRLTRVDHVDDLDFPRRGHCLCGGSANTQTYAAAVKWMQLHRADPELAPGVLATNAALDRMAEQLADEVLALLPIVDMITPADRAWLNANGVA